MKPPSDSELLAERVIRYHLRPANVRRIDLNTGVALHDFEVDCADGTVAAVEVTEDRDPAEALWRAQRTQILEVPKCQDGWSIALGAPPAKPRKWAKSELEPFLVQLENSSATEITIYANSPFKASIPSALASLGFVGAKVDGNVPTGQARLSIEGWPRVERTDYLSHWIEGFSASGRCRGEREKLVRSSRAERHLAVVVPFFPASGWSVFATLQAMEWYGPPLRVPVLPIEITHCWIVSSYPGVCSLFFSPRGGWELTLPDCPLN